MFLVEKRGRADKRTGPLVLLYSFICGPRKKNVKKDRNFSYRRRYHSLKSSGGGAGWRWGGMVFKRIVVTYDRFGEFSERTEEKKNIDVN